MFYILCYVPGTLLKLYRTARRITNFRADFSTAGRARMHLWTHLKRDLDDIFPKQPFSFCVPASFWRKEGRRFGPTGGGGYRVCYINNICMCVCHCCDASGSSTYRHVPSIVVGASGLCRWLERQSLADSSDAQKKCQALLC